MEEHAGDLRLSHHWCPACRRTPYEATAFADWLAEAALAHAKGDKVGAAYKRGDALKKRERLMEACAQRCAGTWLGEGEGTADNIVPMRARCGVRTALWIPMIRLTGRSRRLWRKRRGSRSACRSSYDRAGQRVEVGGRYRSSRAARSHLTQRSEVSCGCARKHGVAKKIGDSTRSHAGPAAIGYAQSKTG
jgi:hypothetical protein